MIEEKYINKLPKDWKWVELGEVASYLNGRAFKPSEWEKEGKQIIRIQNLNNSEAKYNYTTNEFDKRYKVVKNDLLFAWSASLGAYIWKGNEAWLNQHIFKVVPRVSINKTYLFYLLEKIVQELYSKAHGSGMVHVTKGKFEETKIPLPPLPTQHAIVSKIEELFSELDKGIENLRLAQQQLKTYRQSVLKWAFEGRLTNEDVKEGELPNGWKIVKIGEICKSIVPNRDKPKSFTGNIRWITTPNLSENSIRLNYENVKFGLSENEVKEYNARVIPVDGVIMTCVGTFGLSAIVEKPIVINQQLHAFITNEKVHSKYLAYCIQLNKQYFESKSTSTTIQYLNKENCNSMPFPLCSIEEQKNIVQEIESRLSVADKMEESIAHSLKKSDTLRQSILKKAFEGKLVTN